MPASKNHRRNLPSRACPQDFSAEIQRALNQTNAAFASTPSRQHTALLREIIGDSDVCVGVFNDPDSPQGWSHLIIKGTHALRRIAKNGLPENFKLAAISCREPEEALAMKQVFGEKA